MKFFLAAGIGLLAFGCTRGDAAAGSSRLPRVLSSEFPVRLELADGVLELPAPPRRVLPANAAWIDFVSVLIAPERVVALPNEAFGYSRLARDPGDWAALPPFPTFEGERVLALAPDLVLAHAWQNPETIASLRRAGVPVLVVPVPESWDEILRTLELVGTVLGERARAGTLVAELEARRARLAERGARFARLRALSYTNLGAGGWVSGANTTAEILFELAGVRNAAADAGLRGDVPADQERLLALAPDLFLVGQPDRSESAPPSASFLRTEPALRGLAALRGDHIVTLPPALFSTASPELLAGAEELVAALEAWERAGTLAPAR